jgi:hypothetical protein
MPRIQFPGTIVLLAVGLTASCTFSLPYSVSRTSRYFNLPLSLIAAVWMSPPAKLLVFLAPLAGVLWWATEPFGDTAKLLVRAVPMSLVAGVLLIRVGVDETTREDLLTRAPSLLTRPLRVIVGVSR